MGRVQIPEELLRRSSRIRKPIHKMDPFPPPAARRAKKPKRPPPTPKTVQPRTSAVTDRHSDAYLQLMHLKIFTEIALASLQLCVENGYFQRFAAPGADQAFNMSDVSD